MITSLSLALLSFYSLSPAVAGGLFPSNPFSDRALGSTGAAFLKMPVGARAAALGGTYAAASGGTESIYWNPAGLARLEGSKRKVTEENKGTKGEVDFSHNRLLETSHLSSLSYAFPFKGSSVLGVAALYHSQGSIGAYNSFGDSTGSFTPYDLAVAVSGAREFKRFALGANIKAIRSKLAEESGSAIAVDLGAQFPYILEAGQGPIDVGIVLRNFGAPLRLGSVSDPLPLLFQLGFLWKVGPYVDALWDGHFPVDQNPYLSFGLEVSFPYQRVMKAMLRGGYNLKNARDNEGLAGFTAGAGLDVGRFHVDYAWVPLGDLEATHRFSMGLRF